MVEKDGADAVTPVVQFSFPPQRAFIIRDNALEYQYPENASVRSQDLEAVYHDCGQFYVMRPYNILHDVESTMTMPLIMKESEVQDIDTIEDWKIAEIKYKLMINSML